MTKAIKNFLNGAAFGITQIIPGVSGGTVAIILGFYDELIASVNNFRKDFKQSLKFLCPVLLGAAAGLLTFGSVINFLLANYSFPVMMFFIGLIIGIIPIIYKKTGGGLNFKELLLVIAPVVILAAISYIRAKTGGGAAAADPAETMRNISVLFMIYLFFAGILASAALIIPGISGSFVFLILGVYPLITHALSSVKNLPQDTGLLLDICKVLVPLGIGIIIGGLATARLIGRLLKNHGATVYLIILGLLLGSAITLFAEPVVFASGVSAPVIITGAATVIAGAVLSFLLGKKRF